MATPQQLANLASIAKAAVNLEKVMGVPAELCTAQCILESNWLAKAPGNNPFGIKAAAGKPSVSVLTREMFTPQQLKKAQAQGKKIQSVGPLVNGLHKVMMYDDFAAFDTLDDAFLAYGRLLVKGKYFAARFARYQKHKNVEQLLNDMQGADGLPAYATDKNYVPTVLKLIKQSNVQAALASARSALAVPHA